MTPASPDPAQRPVLVAPDAFKGTFTAAEVTDTIAAGLEAAGMAADRCPLADGGEGTAAVLCGIHGGTTHTAKVTGPLGTPVTAEFTLLDPPAAKRRAPRTAVLDMASASGLPLIPEHARDPFAATTYGTGELIIAAINAGAERVLIACGGSATVDGGAGAIEAINDAGATAAVNGAKLTCLTDVQTTWAQCATTFGPQKGATTPELVAELEQRLRELVATFPTDPSQVPGSGAAGGLAGGLHAAFGATIEPGAPHVLAAAGADARMRTAAFVIVGEGRIDRTSLRGKVTGELATRARQAGVPCSAVVGQDQISRFDARIIDLMEIVEASTKPELVDAGALLARRWLAATTS